MARQKRNFVNGVMYHVIPRGSRRRTLFRCEKDCEKYRDLLLQACSEFSISIFHYVLMPNRVHLLLSSAANHISDFLKYVNMRYALYFCAKYQVCGGVWRPHPKDKPVTKDEYLFAVSHYIERNPVKAELCRRASEWKYSSFGHYAFGKYDPLVTDDPLYISYSKKPEERQARYRHLVSAVRRREDSGDFE